MISKLLFLIAIISNFAYSNEVMVKMTLSPAGSFEAITSKLHGDIKHEGSKITADSLWIKVDDLKTGIDLRDEHFHKYLNFEKFPKIYLNKVTAENGKGTAILIVNEISNQVAFNYKKVSEKIIEVSLKTKASFFKLKSASYLDIGVEDEVEVVAKVDI